ncbi:hypothetical protein BCR33DRAFT_716000 [Rhizoclosmatium globosum]|uniref:DM2 domain-containing protein n=1 Tax=Rhizoclosmatium globosum TaxID=329046 RepID=A0A1Y2CG22_9FUNG|nr:hypothetical protein BCR33DRAFT_716000 [Rhizoclosmatium globosum]|eukprot:ORY45990.1 hypothetical protein BCR33DRAFT_716000 [Rhizoclosmatium globosum]
MQNQQQQQFRPQQMTMQQMQQMQQMNMGRPMMYPGQPQMGMPMMGMPGGQFPMPGPMMGAPPGAGFPQQKRSGAPGDAVSAPKRRKPMDRTLPSKLDFVPEAKLYAQLQASERKLDAAVAAKKAELQEALVRPPRTKKTLRLWIQNSAANQQQPGTASGSELDLNAPAPSWTLRLHGVLLEEDGSDKGARAKLSSLFRSISVRVVRDKGLYAEGNTVEWRKDESPNQDFEGFEVTKKGDTEVQVKIALVVDTVPEKFKLSPDLADIVNVQVETKTNVVMRLWQYIKLHGLQDVEDKRIINYDDALQKIFKTKKAPLTHLPDHLNAHFFPLDPITLDYTIKLDKPLTTSSVGYDIDVEVDSPIKANILSIVGGGDPTPYKEISAIDDEITKLVQKVTQCKHKREFMLSYAKDPVGFLNQWVASQTRDLETVLGDSRINAEEARRASFYKDNWVNEAVFHYLNSV